MQKESLIELLNKLKGYDLCLYTSYSIDEVPKEIIDKLKYIKTGRYIEKLKNNKIPYYGSSNQKFYVIKDGKYEEI